MRALAQLLVLATAVLVASPGLAQTVTYLHTDALGTPIAVTDAAGNIIETSEYSPYGDLLNRPDSDGPGYTGHVQDAATGMTYMQQRYYDAALGVFLSVDPVATVSNPTTLFNVYRYANGNPYGFTDPDGRLACGTGVQNPICEKRVTNPGNPWSGPSDHYFGGSKSPASVLKRRKSPSSQKALFEEIGEDPEKIDQMRETHAEFVNTLSSTIIGGGVFGVRGAATKLGLGGRSIRLVDGFYQAEGSAFKFSQRYYEKLWKTGRQAPFLQAEEVLNTATSIRPDRLKGFYRYANESMEMVYNPKTKEVWHMQPIGR